MRSASRTIIFFSLLFFIIEIWEPSTNFVRATIEDPGQHPTPSASAQVLKYQAATPELPPLLTPDSQFGTGSHKLFDEGGISHCSVGFYYFNFKSFDLISIRLFLKPLTPSKAVARVIDRPPIASLLS